MKHRGWTMKETTAEAFHAGTSPDEMDDAYVVLPGEETLREVWDVGVMVWDDKVALYGNFPDAVVPKTWTIFYSPPERWEAE